MDTENIAFVLPKAKKLGLLVPSEENNICYARSVATANSILHHLEKAGEQGLSTSQATQRIRIHANTLKCYLRELVKLDLVEKYKSGQEEAIWTLKKK